MNAALLSPSSRASAAPAPATPMTPPRERAEPVPIAIAELVSHRPYLVRFAVRKLRDAALAEDAVHDVIEAVLSGRARFGGRAALRSWLTAVLKNKIVDTLRRADHHHDALDDDEGGEGAAHGVACLQPRPDEIAAQREELARRFFAGTTDAERDLIAYWQMVKLVEEAHRRYGSGGDA